MFNTSIWPGSAYSDPVHGLMLWPVMSPGGRMGVPKHVADFLYPGSQCVSHLFHILVYSMGWGHGRAMECQSNVAAGACVQRRPMGWL